MEIGPSTYRTGTWVNPRAGLDDDDDNNIY
jgi:hypothetical protein